MSLVGETLLSCALTEIFKKMGSVVTEGISGAWKLEADLEKLRESIGRIREAQVTADDENFWKLQEVIYCAENVLDEFHYKTHRHEAEYQLKNKLRDFVSLNNPVLYRTGMATRVKKLNDKVELLEYPGTHAPLLAAANSGVATEDRETRHFLENKPFGRTDEVEAIIQMLQAASSHQSLLTVISIVGFGGIGKTFFAKLVNKQAEEKKLFEHFMWVCVSEPFLCAKILERMLQLLHLTGGMQGNIEALVLHLREKLQGKRLFLVLDDVWNEEKKKWEDLEGCLKDICGESGKFVILVTARSKVVADTMESKHSVELNQLSAIECWSIIKEKVVGDEGESVISKDMENIGKKIAGKCGGVPLAAKVLGGVLRSRMNKDEWSSIQNSDLWNEVDKDKRTLRVLKLSYDRLLPSQKLCFAYCSLFPKDFEFDKAQLIQLWMAEGFLETNEEKSEKLMEDVGEEYFHSFLAYSFFQDAQVDDSGNIVGCKMHDFLHDLSSTISNSQRLPCGSDCIQTSDGCRMSFSCDQVSEVQKILASSNDKTRNSRSLFCRVDVSPMLSNFRRLRSLDMSRARLKDLPAAIQKSKHLRYLDISHNKYIKVLPEFITKLYNLQTLRVFDCMSLQRLPSKIISLVSLRHICFDDKRLMPSKVGDLIDLQTLSIFVVGQDGQVIDELGKLKQLKGYLLVCGLENVKDKGEAERAKLKEKKLSKLGLGWTEVSENEVENICCSREGNHEEVMEGIGAPANTQELTVEWYMGKQFPGWMSELKKLVRLTLQDCRKCEKMPTLGHLPNLKKLLVQCMNGIKVIGDEFYGESNNVNTLFPLLEEFFITEMRSLLEWVAPTGIVFPKLRKLDISDCPNLTSFPLSQSTSSAIGMKLRSFEVGVFSVDILCSRDFKSLQDLDIRKCPKLTFHHIGLTSIQPFYYSRYEKFPCFDNLLECSNKLGKSWIVMGMRGVAEIIREFPKSLEILKIEESGNELPTEAFHGLSRLKHLVIRSCKSLESNPNLSSLISLKHLNLRYCDCLKSIPTLSSFSTCLEKLVISECHNLRSLSGEIKLCTSLKELRVANCRGMVSIDDDVMGYLTQLEELKWGGFSRELDQLPGLDSIHLLTSLQKLSIIGWNKLTSLPSQIQRLTSVTHLEISNFYGLESLPDWICELSSLQTLHIPFCMSLENLTTSGQRLSGLTELVILCCPLLAERCVKDTGPEWSNISHIPYIEIDSEVIQDVR